MNRFPHLQSPLLLLLGLLTACSGSQAKAGPGPEAERQVRELITALTPPAATALPVEKSEYYSLRKQTLVRLRAGGEAIGLEALRVYRESPPELPEVRAGLLDVAAHAAPTAAEPLLVELVTRFGEDLLVRRAATEHLGATAPQRACEVLEPILRERLDGRTYPPEDQMLEAWIGATERLGKDPVPLLTNIATDLQRPQEVRHLATRALGRHPGPLGRQALENLLVESSGNGYIRRLALQSLRASLPPEEFCKHAKAVQDRESDPEFIVVIQDALDESCR